MSRTRIQLSFAKGDRFEVELHDDAAPQTVAIIRQRLPFEYTFFQSIVSGQALVCLPPDLTVPRENQRVAGILAGTLCFLVKDEPVLVPDEIYIAYGTFISRGLTVDMKQPVNVFGQVVGDLDALARACRRVHMEGAETVRFEALS
jgi:hypothetical protein